MKMTISQSKRIKYFQFNCTLSTDLFNSMKIQIANIILCSEREQYRDSGW